MEIDYFLYTDGSGHQDGYGGWSSLLVSDKHNIYDLRMTACKGTTTDRAEFEALLSGLQTIVDFHKLDIDRDFESFRQNRPGLLWTSDRQSLVGSVQRDADGNPVNRRRKMLDLWARFAFYEPLFSIHARYIPRESNPYQSITDVMASDGRVLIKNFMELPERQPSFLLEGLPTVTVASA